MILVKSNFTDFGDYFGDDSEQVESIQSITDPNLLARIVACESKITALQNVFKGLSIGDYDLTDVEDLMNLVSIMLSRLGGGKSS